MELTEQGNKLFKEISPVIEKIVEIDKNFSSSKELVFGTYGTMLSKVLSGSIAEFYAENKDDAVIEDSIFMLLISLSSILV